MKCLDHKIQNQKDDSALATSALAASTTGEKKHVLGAITYTFGARVIIAFLYLQVIYTYVTAIVNASYSYNSTTSNSVQ